MSLEPYLDYLKPGTLIEFCDLAVAIIDDSGYVIQKMRGNQDESQSYYVYTTVQDWLNTLKYKIGDESILPINLWLVDSLITPAIPIYEPTNITPYKLVYDILRKNHIGFKCTKQESKNMCLARAKIDLLKLECDSYWLDLRITNEKEWLNEFNHRFQIISDLKTEIANMTMAQADNRPYVISGTKYPRVYVKLSDSKMVPVYYTTDGSEEVIVDGISGKDWTTFGPMHEPEFWVSYNGTFIKQEISYYLPSKYEKSKWEEDKTQLELAFSYTSQPDEFGFLPCGKLVYNTKTKKYLQPRFVV